MVILLTSNICFNVCTHLSVLFLAVIFLSVLCFIRGRCLPVFFLKTFVLVLPPGLKETWRQHVTGGKLREITEEAKNFAIGNKALAALFVHTPAGELQRQIRTWLAENFEFLSVTDGDGIGGGSGQLELLSTAIMDGWMAGLGSAQRPSTDALGQLLSEYTKRVYTSQLQHLKVDMDWYYLPML